MRVGLCMHVGMCVYACASSEGPHAGKGWGSVGRRDSYIQVISNLEALRLQRHGVICALPARHCTANILQPERGGDRNVSQYTVCSKSPFSKWTARAGVIPTYTLSLWDQGRRC